MSKFTRCLIALLLAWLAAPALAEELTEVSDTDLFYEDRIAELERSVKVLAEELERTRSEVTVPEEPELKSSYGMGPAASKVYQLARGLSIGGYGEAYYRNYVADQTWVPRPPRSISSRGGFRSEATARPTTATTWPTRRRSRTPPTF
jgi:hypothetical protein